MNHFTQQSPTIGQTFPAGINSIECLVNGEPFLPNPVPGQKPAVYAELNYYRQATGINLYADNFSKDQTLVMFFYTPMHLVVGKKYDLCDPDFFVQFIDYQRVPSCTYRALVQGIIALEECRVGKSETREIAGSFEFTVTFAECDEFIRVTNGRFRVTDISE